MALPTPEEINKWPMSRLIVVLTQLQLVDFDLIVKGSIEEFKGEKIETLAAFAETIGEEIDERARPKFP